MPRWVRIRSWHHLRTFTRDGGALTRCGKRARPPVSTAEELDLNDKSCESCLRFAEVDRAKGEA